MTKQERVLRSILKQAQSIQVADPTGDDTTNDRWYYLIGGIIVNAEDALGGIEATKDWDRLNAMMRGGIVVSR